MEHLRGWNNGHQGPESLDGTQGTSPQAGDPDNFVLRRRLPGF